MTTSNFNNVKLVKGTYTVTIATISDEENLTKYLILITPPKAPAEQEVGGDSNTTKIIDLLMKAEKRITFDGYLVKDIASGDSSDTPQDKKADLKHIFFDGGVITMTYEGETFRVNSDKLSIKRVPTEGLTNEEGIGEFLIKMTVVRGED